MITDCRDLWPRIVSRSAGHFDSRLTPYRWSLSFWWLYCCYRRTIIGYPHLRHLKCAIWSPYIFILLITTLTTAHEMFKRFKKVTSTCDLVYGVMLLAGWLGCSWLWWLVKVEEVLTYWRIQVVWSFMCCDPSFISCLRQSILAVARRREQGHWHCDSEG